jgi:hypothetical protein
MRADCEVEFKDAGVCEVTVRPTFGATCGVDVAIGLPVFLAGLADPVVARRALGT